jgi:hypothetical protein
MPAAKQPVVDVNRPRREMPLNSTAGHDYPPSGIQPPRIATNSAASDGGPGGSIDDGKPPGPITKPSDSSSNLVA